MLERRGNGLRLAVIGASGGIGGALVRLAKDVPQVDAIYALSRSRPQDLPEGAEFLPIDITNETSVLAAADKIEAKPLDIVIVASGVLHNSGGIEPEKDWRHLNAGRLAQYFAVNAIGPALVAKHFLPLMRKDSAGVFAALSARVGSISDNSIGGWYGYRASKAALNMMIRNLAIELKRKRYETICVGLHPGTVATRLSEPFRSNTRPGQVVTPDEAARNLLNVIDRLTTKDSGNLISWDGTTIAP